MWSMDRAHLDASGDTVYYPPRGYVPVNMFGPSQAWSIMLPSHTKLKKKRIVVRVRMLDDDYRKQPQILKLNHLSVMPGRGLPACLIFRPAGIRVKRGYKYWTEVSLDGGPVISTDAELLVLGLDDGAVLVARGTEVRRDGALIATVDAANGVAETTTDERSASDGSM